MLLAAPLLPDTATTLRADPDELVEAAIAGVAVGNAPGGPQLVVTGTASARAFASARVQIGAGDNAQSWRDVASLSAPVAGAELARIPATALHGSAVWTIRLMVTNAAGQSREARFRLTLGE